jgi:hypothetical protein
MSQPNANNVEPKLSGDMAAPMADNSAMGVMFSGVQAKMPMSGIGEMNTLKPVSTPSDGGGKNM